MTDVMPFSYNENEESSFDKKIHYDENGEYWLAREIVDLYGYEWRRFEDTIERAMIACANSGQVPANNFANVGKVISEGSRGPVAKDYKLSRYACYLIAMNGDPRKPEIANAQTYFAVKAREAELGIAQQPKNFPDALRAWADAIEEAARAKAQVKELEPKAEEYDQFMDTEGLYNWFDCARLLYNDTTQNGSARLIAKLRDLKIIKPKWQAINASPYQDFVNKGWFVVKRPAHIRNPQTFITVHGVSAIYKKLKAAGEEVVETSPFED